MWQSRRHRRTRMLRITWRMIAPYASRDIYHATAKALQILFHALVWYSALHTRSSSCLGGPNILFPLCSTSLHQGWPPRKSHPSRVGKRGRGLRPAPKPSAERPQRAKTYGGPKRAWDPLETERDDKRLITLINQPHVQRRNVNIKHRTRMEANKSQSCIMLESLDIYRVGNLIEMAKSGCNKCSFLRATVFAYIHEMLQ